MRASLLASLGFAGVAALVPLVGPASPPPAPDAPLVRSDAAARGCEPRAPVALVVEAPPAARGAVLLSYRATPELAAERVAVEVRLPHGGRVVSQGRAVARAVAPGEAVAGHARVALPGGVPGASIEVVATVEVRRPDGRLAVGRTVERVTYGTPAADVARVTTGGEPSSDVRAVTRGGGR